MMIAKENTDVENSEKIEWLIITNYPLETTTRFLRSPQKVSEIKGGVQHETQFIPY
jgi:hypothetical protein